MYLMKDLIILILFIIYFVAVTVLMTRDLGVNKKGGTLAHGSCGGVVGKRDSVDIMTTHMTGLYWGGLVVEEGTPPPGLGAGRKSRKCSKGSNVLMETQRASGTKMSKLKLWAED